MDIPKARNRTTSMFNSIAPSYDKLNRLISLGLDQYWRRVLIKKLANPTGNVLDLATGTGDVAIKIAQTHKNTKIIAIDPALNMLEVGQAKVRSLGLTNKITFEQGNSQKICRPNNFFECVTISFGVRNFSKINSSFNEILRVLAPGGRVFILEFQYPKNPFIAWCFDLYMKCYLTIIGKAVSRNEQAYDYLMESIKHFGERVNLKSCLEGAGFINIKTTRLNFGTVAIYEAEKIAK